MSDSLFSGLFTEAQAKEAAVVLSIGASFNSMVSAFYGVQAQKDAAKEQAAQIAFEAQVSEMNAVLVEQQIAKGRDALRKNIGISQMAYRERMAQETTGAAARNGSVAEQQAGLQLASDLDALTMTIDAETQFSGMARQATNLKGDADMGRVRASNLRTTAKAMSPTAAFLTQGVSSAAKVTGMFYKQFGS